MSKTLCQVFFQQDCSFHTCLKKKRKYNFALSQINLSIYKVCVIYFHLNLYWNNATFMLLLLFWRMFVIHFLFQNMKWFSLKFSFFTNNAFENIFNHTLEFYKLCLWFGYTSSANLIFTCLSLNSFQNTALFFILLVLSNSFDSRVTLKDISWFSF